MNLTELKAYADLVGARWELRTHDAGQVLHMTHERHEVTYRWEWGQEYHFLPLAERWLNGLPWPTEDDPRVEHEGVTL